MLSVRAHNKNEKTPAKTPAFTKTTLLEMGRCSSKFLNKFDKCHLYYVYIHHFSHMGMFSLLSHSMEKQDQLLDYWSYRNNGSFATWHYCSHFFSLVSKFTRFTQSWFFSWVFSIDKVCGITLMLLQGSTPLTILKKNKVTQIFILFHGGTNEHLCTLEVFPLLPILTLSPSHTWEMKYFPQEYKLLG